MRKIFSKILLFLRIACLGAYTFSLYELWALCQFGGLRRHTTKIMVGAGIFVVLFVISLFFIKPARTEKKKWEEEQEEVKNQQKKWVLPGAFLAITLLFAGRILYAAIPYHGELSWKLEEYRNEETVELLHDQFFVSGVEGILSDIREKVDLPQELYLANKVQITFNEKGTIQTLYTMLYGRDENGKRKTFLIDYDRNKSKNMTIWKDGSTGAEDGYPKEMLLQPMLRILEYADCKERVENWYAQTGETTYEILYFGKRAFSTVEGLVCIPGDVDGDGIDGGVSNIDLIFEGGEVAGYEVSLHIPKMDFVTPVRYMMEPSYTTVDKVEKQREETQIDTAKESNTWLISQDGSVTFFLDETYGYRLVVVDAAAGSRFYGFETTENGGETFQVRNGDPFSGSIGVANGVLFLDKDKGYISLTNAGGDYATLYETKDGGKTFEKVDNVLDEDTELPEHAKEWGLSISDYDYVNMPVKKGDQWTVWITTQAGETEGIEVVLE